MTNSRQQPPHGFCVTPEQKCTMDYCDENGCQNRKRTSAEPTEMPNNKQLTAVDILCGKLAMKLGIPQAITFYIDHAEEIAEAKAMHKEEIENSFVECWKANMPDGYECKLSAKEYYNETFGGNND